MSQPLSAAVATIQELYRCFRERDDNGFRALCAEHIEWRQNEGFPNGQTYHGADAVIQHVFDANLLAWSGFHFAIEEYLDAGDQVVVLGHYGGRHQNTGKAMHAAAAHVYKLHDGRVTRFRMYADTETIWRSVR